MSAIPRVVLGESCEFLRAAQAVLIHTLLELLDGDGFRQVAGLEIFSPALEKKVNAKAAINSIARAE
jgi:hypothetical protein